MFLQYFTVWIHTWHSQKSFLAWFVCRHSLWANLRPFRRRFCHFWGSFMKKRAKKLVLTVFYCINSYLATWKIVYRSVSLWIITWGLSRPSLASLQGFLQEYHRQKGQKSSFSCILSLYTHPAKGCRMNSNSLMGLFDYFWVTSQYALPRLGWNGNSRAFNRRNIHVFILIKNFLGIFLGWEHKENQTYWKNNIFSFFDFFYALNLKISLKIFW